MKKKDSTPERGRRRTAPVGATPPEQTVGEPDMAARIATMRRQAGLTQTELAQLLETSQQQVSRLEASGYEGQSIRVLRRVAKALRTRLVVTFEPEGNGSTSKVKPARKKVL
jgi:transcriptional regulator with XRE-family HTH domain